MVTTRFVGILIIFAGSVIIAASAPDTLRLVNVVYRHGDRTPEAEYPKDPYKGIWPQGLGWLTEVGMRQQFALGKFLRSEYDNFLNATYRNDEITVASSDVNRCLMSAYCNLAGLYPPQKNQIWNPTLLWQPIPVHTRPQDEDHVLAIDEECPRYDELYEKELHSPAVQEEERVNAEFYTMLEKETGVRTENISEVWMVADTLFCEKTHNLTLPSWTQQKWENGTVYDKLMNLSRWSFDLLYSGSELSRLKGGPLLKRFIQNMQKAASKKEYYKMYMYSAHDSTVAAVSDAMKVFNGFKPPYATALLVELHEMNNTFCVEIRYRNETTRPPFTLVHPDCQKECCPLDQFIEVTKASVPVDWEAECGNVPDIYAEEITVMTVVLLVALTLLFIVVLVLAYYFFRQRRIIKTFELM